MIHFSCPKCGKGIKVGDAGAGKDGKCPACGAPVHVPDAPAATPQGPPPLRRDQRTAVVPDEAPPTVTPPTEEAPVEVSQAESAPPPIPPDRLQTSITDALRRLGGRKREVIIGLAVCVVVVILVLIIVLVRSSRPSVPELFKTQLMKFIEEGTKACERSGQGVSYLELREQLASVKASYSLCKATWPKSLPQEMTADFDHAIRAWDLILDIWKDKLEYSWSDYQSTYQPPADGFDIGEFEKYLILLVDDKGRQSRVVKGQKYLPWDENISILLTVASDSFGKGRDKILAELQ
jgi:hypothetical protein